MKEREVKLSASPEFELPDPGGRLDPQVVRAVGAAAGYASARLAPELVVPVA
ncbi:MAG: hypothetical protein ACXVW5_30050 [Solirubrobacteraceae bacterium]